MKTTTILLILTCGILFALTFAPYNATTESIPGSIFVEDEWRTKPSVYTPPVNEYTACIKITSNRTVEEIMVYHPDKPYVVAIDDEGYVLIHFNLTLDEFADDVVRFAEINAIEDGELWCNGTTVGTRQHSFEAEKRNLSPMENLTTFLSSDCTDQRDYIRSNHDCKDFSIQLARNLSTAGFDAGCLIITPKWHGMSGGHMMVHVVLPDGTYVIESMNDVVTPLDEVKASIDQDDYVVRCITIQNAVNLRTESRQWGTG